MIGDSIVSLLKRDAETTPEELLHIGRGLNGL